MGGSPPGSAGVPPAQILPQLQPSPPPESTGSGALPLLRPGGRLHHRRETKRQPKGQHAGGTPALPGVSSRWRGGGYPAGDFSEGRPVPFGKLPFACEPGAHPPRLGRSIEKDYKLNIDAQDAQDNQGGRLLQETRTRAMIACGFEDVREHKPAVSGKNPVHPVHRCESKIYPCLTMNRFPATRRRHLFQVSPAPAPHDGADHSRVKQVLFQVRTTEPPFLPRTFGQTRFALPYTPQGQASHDRLLQSTTHPRHARTRSHVHHQGHDTQT